jgi:hypothetical protein
MKKQQTSSSSQPSDCSVTINIETSGNINIYNCSGKDNECGCKDGGIDYHDGSEPIGSCVPASLGAKPKQSRDQKLNRLLNKTKTSSAMAAAFLQACRRFAAGKTPGSEIEAKMFQRFSQLSPELKKVMRCTGKSYDSINEQQKTLFAKTLLQDIDTAVTAENLAEAMNAEISAHVANTALQLTALEERPGKARLFEIPPGEEVFDSQVKIFRINGLRTSDYLPRLNVNEYLPEEFQQSCTPQIVGDHTEWNCSMQQPPCDGIQFDTACMRVLQIQSGTSVELDGVNFFNINAQIQFKIKFSSDNYRRVDAFVYGDITTPVKETINGEQKLITDSRVKDKIFFTVPADTPPGIYEFNVVVPNNSSIPSLGQELVSNVQFIEVVPPSTARFQIASENLRARRETAPQSWGSDEVGIKTIAIPFFEDLTLGEPQEHSFRFGDVDSQENRTMERVLFSHNQPIAGVVLTVTGYEIDGEEAYKKQITEWTDVFVELLKEQWAYILASGTITKELLKRLTNLGFWGYVIIGIAIAVTLAIDLFVALWAPADLIIEDTMGLSTTDLVRLTDVNIPAPVADSDKTIATSPNDIELRLMQTNKTAFEYKEERGYVCDDEDSWYNIRFRFNRLQ